MYCHKCGKQVENEQAAFCPYCGAQLKDRKLSTNFDRENWMNTLNLKKAMYIISAICGLSAISIYLYASATVLQGHRDNIICEIFGGWWFDDYGIYFMGVLLIICVITGVIGFCTKPDRR